MSVILVINVVAKRLLVFVQDFSKQREQGSSGLVEEKRMRRSNEEHNAIAWINRLSGGRYKNEGVKEE
ncbi:MAG: hypothetical protein Q4A75_01695 [Peptostreptococcaceae bacterium]|nr:hypothetical protein [Peptostreptococcaceae bacterium]